MQLRAMSDIKLFRLTNSKTQHLRGTSAVVEKSLQSQIEKNLETLIGVRFLASEFSTGREHGGRMDTIGIDENNCPVIIEYKRTTNTNVINQGLFYLDWLVTHRGDFEMLVLKTHGEKAAKSVEWSNPRLICIASDFSKYDEHAINQMNRNIELVRYLSFEDNLLLLEQVNVVANTKSETQSSSVRGAYKTITEILSSIQGEFASLVEDVRSYIFNLGDDVQENTLKYYVAFKRIANFACLEVRPTPKTILIYLKLDPTDFQTEDGFTRDMRNIGHYGTGDLEVTIRTKFDFEKAKHLIERSYQGS